MGQVGFVGTGAMGSAMVRRLLLAGHEVVIFDAHRAAMDPLVEAGAAAAESVEDVARRCRTVITSLPGPSEVAAVARLINGAASPGDLHVGHSTVSVESAVQTAADAGAAGLRFLDAPVSGGTMGADAGTLAVLASGPPDALADAKVFLDAYTGRLFELGVTAGAGTLAKLVNNAIFLCSGLVHQEAVVLATKAGMEPQVLDDLLGASSAAMYLGLAKPTLSRDWDGGGFTVSLAEKDIALALESARALDVPMPVTAAAHQHYVHAKATGHADRVCFSTLAAIEASAGVHVPARTWA
jgi:3-hydroxyisobutyrate dehydrogenase